MTASQLKYDAVQFELVATSATAMLAVDPLIQHFGLSRSEAEEILTAGWGFVAPRLGVARARASLPLLASLGLRASVRGPDAAPQEEQCDISVRLNDLASLPNVAATLTGLGFGQITSAERFRGPSGLVLGGLSKARAEALCRSLAHARGVEVIQACRARARYDIFIRDTGQLAVSAALMRFIAVMGHGSKGPAPALATGLDRRSAQILLDRFPDAGLLAVNQAFQRYDLCVTGPGLLSLRELQDFLATRGVRTEIRLQQAISASGFRVETGLSRPLAQQFMVDYATIGIPVRAELVCH